MKANVISDRDYHGVNAKFERDIQNALNNGPSGYFVQDIKVAMSENEKIFVIIWAEIPTST